MENIAFVQTTIVAANIEIIFEFSILLLVFLE
jgi:hypothetical protein